LEIDYHWDAINNKWVAQHKNEYSYNGNGKDTLIFNYSWDATSNKWINSGQYKYSFDANGNDTLESYCIWDATNNQWNVSFRGYYYYSSHNPNSIYSTRLGRAAKLYPNPANNFYNIETGDNSVTQCQIYNTEGQLVKMLKPFQGTNTYNICNLKPGLYFIEISTKNGRVIQKLIKN